MLCVQIIRQQIIFLLLTGTGAGFSLCVTVNKNKLETTMKNTIETLDHINAAMEILAHRIAHEPASVVGSSDREVYKLLRDALPAIGALIELHADSECYCPENLAVKAVCPFCRAKNQMKVVKVGDKGNVLVEFFTKLINEAAATKPKKETPAGWQDL